MDFFTTSVLEFKRSKGNFLQLLYGRKQQMAVVKGEWTQEIKEALDSEALQKLAAIGRSTDTMDLSEKRLLTVAEFANYLGIGQTTARAILKNTRLGYRVKIKNTIMINKKLLDEYLDKQSY